MDDDTNVIKKGTCVRGIAITYKIFKWVIALFSIFKMGLVQFEILPQGYAEEYRILGLYGKLH